MSSPPPEPGSGKMGKPVGEQAAALAKRLRAELERYPAGRRFLSHGEIRKRFGANLRVVMAALELLRAEGALELRERIGSFSRLSARERKPVILFFHHDYPSAFHADWLRALREQEERTGAFRLLPHPYDYQRNDFTGCSLEAADAVTLGGATRNWSEREYRWLLTLRPPVLLCGDGFENDRISYLTQQEYMNGILAARHFLERGHRRLAMIRSMPPRQCSRRRADSFRQEAAFGGAAVEMLDCHAENGEYPPECAAELLDARLNRAPCDFTGLLIDTAGAAPGVLEALHAHGLNIPGDLSCIVIDNLTQLDRSNPPLTAVGVDFAELAECMVHHLLDRIHGRCAPAVLELAPRLFDRGSVRKIREFL